MEETKISFGKLPLVTTLQAMLVNHEQRARNVYTVRRRSGHLISAPRSQAQPALYTAPTTWICGAPFLRDTPRFLSAVRAQKQLLIQIWHLDQTL